MEYYEEYPIRCKTCNEQIACFAADYKALLAAGLSVEEALNNLGIMLPCSRAAMFEPVFVNYNMENREVIEGFKSVDAATEADSQHESTSRPIFTPCLGASTAPNAPTIGPVTQATKPAILPVLQPRVQATPRTTLQIRPVIQPVRAQGMTPTMAALPTLGLMQQTRQQAATVVQPIIQPQTVQPIIPGINLEDDVETIGVGIPVHDADAVDITKFREPIAVGIPTINPDPTVPYDQVYVGAGKYVRVLNGRTYLAQ